MVTMKFKDYVKLPLEAEMLDRLHEFEGWSVCTSNNTFLANKYKQCGLKNQYFRCEILQLNSSVVTFVVFRNDYYVHVYVRNKKIRIINGFK